MMAADRRIGMERSENRTALLDAAERIMRQEGYAAVTSRHPAQTASRLLAESERPELRPRQ